MGYLCPKFHLMKKKIHVLLVAFFALLSVGCSDFEYGTSIPPTHWYHAQLLGFYGAVHTIAIHDATASQQLVDAEFDAYGRCVRWNDTGVMNRSDYSTRAWGSETAWYEYKYNAEGAVVEVRKYVLGGDVETFRISYGNHTINVPAPFPLGNLPCWIAGVSRIESEHYTLTCDGKSVKAERRMYDVQNEVWKSQFHFQQSTVTEEDIQIYTIAEDGEQKLSRRRRVLYDFSGPTLNRIIRIDTDEDGHKVRFETLYNGNTMRPLRRKLFSGDEQQPTYEAVYEYDYRGRLTVVRDEKEFFETPYTIKYQTEDMQRNFLTATRTMGDQVQNLQSTITYW